MLMLSLRRKATMVAVGAAIVGSVAIATPAQADQPGDGKLGEVTVYNASWESIAMHECKEKYPATKRVWNYSTNYLHDPVAYNWNCYAW